MPDELAYAATKGAIEAFTKSVAPVAMEKGITVNALIQDQQIQGGLQRN